MKTRSRFALVRDKLQVFFLGLLLGLVLGGGFFLLKLDQYVQELSFYKNIVSRDNSDRNNPLAKKSDQSVESKTTPSKTRTRKQSFVDTVKDSLSQTQLLTATRGSASDDDIIVRKDQLVAEQQIALINLDAPPSLIDSLAQTEAGVRDEQARKMTIEFWESPLHYRGYKLTRSRLVLFGLGQERNIALYKLNNLLYLKSSNGVFRLEGSSDFRQLERITDEGILSRLN